MNTNDNKNEYTNVIHRPQLPPGQPPGTVISDKRVILPIGLRGPPPGGL